MTQNEISEPQSLSGPKFRFFPLVYGLIHAVVDASCVTALFSAAFIHSLEPGLMFYLVMFYDVLAFAGQAPLGLLIDKFRFNRGAALSGIFFTALSVVMVNFQPLVAMFFAGTGNALYHAGAGALSLHVKPGRATPPGLFVAPGALGLAVGIYMGKGGYLIFWPFLIALAFSFVVAATAENPPVHYPERPKKIKMDRYLPILLLLLFSVTVRSMVGMAGSYECPKAVPISFGFAFAAFAGKALGGIISDRLGWIKTTVWVLVLSAPLLAFGGANHYAITVGIFLFQMTMPVTLVAVASILPGRPAFAFGLPCLALIIGAVPTFYGRFRELFYGPSFFLALIGLSTISVYFGLRMLKGDVQMKFFDQ